MLSQSDNQVDKSQKLQRLSPVQSAVIKTLIYSDIFKYPLTLSEIFNHCTEKLSFKSELQNILDELLTHNLIAYEEGFYFIGRDESIIERRKKGNLLAEKMMKKARKMSGFISSFPFVRAIGLSGSLSKGYMDEQGDIDYFIITQPGRLWISRTLLVLYRMIFRLNSRKYLCTNYFIDSNHLEIPDKNVYAATEILFMIPTYNGKMFNRFLKANDWTLSYKPNVAISEFEKIPSGNNALKTVIEKLMFNRFGNWLDNFLLNKTRKRWKRKFSELSPEDFDYCFRSTPSVSKNHPGNYQKKVTGLLDTKYRDFEIEHGVQFA